MATYQYESVTESIEIEIDQSWAKILKDMDEAEQLNKRKHVRSDHKNSPGVPLSLERLRFEGAWFADRDCCIAATILSADLDRALQTATNLQRRYYILVRIRRYQFTEIARLEGKDESTVRESIRAVEKRIKKYFRWYPRF